jgi:hypothetical protein
MNIKRVTCHLVTSITCGKAKNQVYLLAIPSEIFTYCAKSHEYYFFKQCLMAHVCHYRYAYLSCTSYFISIDKKA